MTEDSPPAKRPDASSLRALCSNVDEWMLLQRKEAAALFSEATAQHDNLVEEMDALISQLTSTATLPTSITHCVSEKAEFSPSSRDGLHDGGLICTPQRKYGLEVGSKLSGVDSTYPAIETVLAARARRLSRPMPSPPTISFDVESPPRPRPSPPTATAALMQLSTAETVHAKLGQILLRPALQAWRNLRPRTNAVGLLLLERGAHAARALAAKAAIARLQTLSQACKQARAAAINDKAVGRVCCLRHAWRRMQAGVERAKADAALVSQSLRCSRVLLLHAALLRCASQAAGLKLLEVAVAAVGKLRASGAQRGLMQRWYSWRARRLGWRRRLCRRAEALGSWKSLHLTSMRAFDPRAVFVEEGATAMADAYRRRRTAASIFCRWMCVAAHSGEPLEWLERAAHSRASAAQDAQALPTQLPATFRIGRMLVSAPPS